MTSHFRQRLLISSLGIVALIISIYYSHATLFKPIFILLNAGIICLALIEYYQLAEHKGFQPLKGLGLLSSLSYIFALSLNFYGYHLAAFPPLVLLFSFLIFFLAYFKHQPFALGNTAVTAFGLLYLTIPLSYSMRINYFFPANGFEDGRLWLTYVLIVSKMTDIGAYFCGKALGTRKLAPTISPKKTIEGALGGIILALFASFMFSKQFSIIKMTVFQSIWIGLLISILSQLGDLAESLLKRDAGVKDSSHLPGLGGVLDVVDSLVFTMPIMYFLLQMHIIGN